jgi:hypothetical protein
MKIKTSELTGAALDWAVAKCEDEDPRMDTPYSTEWAFGGPIIEREKIELRLGRVRYWQVVPARAAYPSCDAPWFFGKTTLIAAMRCRVASKLGDTVDVPEELI